MKKLRVKIFMLCVAMLTGGVASVFLSSIIHFQMRRITLTPDSLKPAHCLQSIASDRQHLALFLCLCGVFLLLSVLLMVSNISGKYESDMKQITPNIKTPVAAGQRQNGSAQWLAKSKIKEAFAIVKTGWENPTIKELMDHGYDPAPDKNNPDKIQKNQGQLAKTGKKRSSKTAKAKKTAGHRKAVAKKHRKNKTQDPQTQISIVSKGWDSAGDEKKRKK